MKVSSTTGTPSPAWPGYQANPHFRVMTAFGLVGVLVLVVGALLFAHFQPVTSPSGIRVSLAMQRYDPSTHSVSGPSTTVFTARQIPAAVLRWGGAPDGVQVGGGWFDNTGYPITQVGPGRPDAMPRVIPLTDSGPVPADTYVFAVGRYQDGRMVEVLAQTQVRVGGS